VEGVSRLFEWKFGRQSWKFAEKIRAGEKEPVESREFASLRQTVLPNTVLKEEEKGNKSSNNNNSNNNGSGNDRSEK